MPKVVTLSLAVLFIGAIVVGMYAYVQSANLDSWGGFAPWMELTPVLFAVCGAGGVIVYAFVRK